MTGTQNNAIWILARYHGKTSKYLFNVNYESGPVLSARTDKDETDPDPAFVEDGV